MIAKCLHFVLFYMKQNKESQQSVGNGQYRLEIIVKYLTIIPWAGVEYINNSLHFARKYARIFILGHYLFLEAHSFPRATLSENCSLLETDNVRGQISEHIFAPNGDYRAYYPSNLLRNARLFQNWEIFSNY